MALDDVKILLPNDTLLEMKDKVNSGIDRINKGEFNSLKIAGDVDIDGVLRVFELETQQTSTVAGESPTYTLSEPPEGQSLEDDAFDRGIVFKYVIPGETEVKTGFFGWSGYSSDVTNTGKFKYIPDATESQGGNSFSGTKGIIDAKIEASDILNWQNAVSGLSGTFVGISTSDLITGQKTISNFLLLTNVNQGTSPTHALTASRSVAATDGVLIDGISGSKNLTADITLSLDSTVVRTSEDQVLLGIKTFGDVIYASDGLIGNATTATVLQNSVNINGVPFDGSQDIEISVSATVDGVFYESNQQVTNNYTVPSGKNAMSVGPIEVLPNVTVTVPEGSVWTIV